jgi:polar amino acid transport system substrate-binding protein
MKTLLKLLAVTLVLAAQPVHARTFEEIKKEGTIVVASEGAFPPFNFFKGPTLTGFEIDLAEALAKKLGLTIEWRALSFDALLAGLRQDRWDMVIASFGVSPERSKAVTFTDPHYCSGGVIVTKNPAIHTVKDLAGKVVVVQTGTTYLEHVRKIPGLKEVKNLPKDTDARSALVAGRADAWVTDRFVAKAAVESNGGKVLEIGDFVFVERIAMAVKKGNTSLQAALNEALKEVMADGTYEAISKKYLHEDVRCR